jgi:hypothetical protein
VGRFYSKDRKKEKGRGKELTLGFRIDLFSIDMDKGKDLILGGLGST